MDDFVSGWRSSGVFLNHSLLAKPFASVGSYRDDVPSRNFVDLVRVPGTCSVMARLPHDEQGCRCAGIRGRAAACRDVDQAFRRCIRSPRGVTIGIPRGRGSRDRVLDGTGPRSATTLPTPCPTRYARQLATTVIGRLVGRDLHVVLVANSLPGCTDVAGTPWGQRYGGMVSVDPSGLGRTDIIAFIDGSAPFLVHQRGFGRSISIFLRSRLEWSVRAEWRISDVERRVNPAVLFRERHDDFRPLTLSSQPANLVFW